MPHLHNPGVRLLTGRTPTPPRKGKTAKARRPRVQVDQDALAAALADLDTKAAAEAVRRRAAALHKRPPVPVDTGALSNELDDARTLSRTGYCQGPGCGRPVNGERTLCGRCLSRRMSRRGATRTD